MPGLVVALPTLPAVVRIYRSSLIGVLDRDYVRAARARGLNGTQVFGRHVARNAAIPIVTVLAFEVGSIMSGRAHRRGDIRLSGDGPGGLPGDHQPRHSGGPGLRVHGQPDRGRHQHAAGHHLFAPRPEGPGAMTVRARRRLYHDHGCGRADGSIMMRLRAAPSRRHCRGGDRQHEAPDAGRRGGQEAHSGHADHLGRLPGRGGAGVGAGPLGHVARSAGRRADPPAAAAGLARRGLVELPVRHGLHRPRPVHPPAVRSAAVAC